MAEGRNYIANNMRDRSGKISEVLNRNPWLMKVQFSSETFPFSLLLSTYVVKNYKIIIIIFTLKTEFLQLDFLPNNRRKFGASDCTNLVNLDMMQPTRVM